MKLVVATTQFPVSSEIPRNARYIRRQMNAAAERGAAVVHFCEGALSGYAGVDFPTFDSFDWDALERCTHEICSLAGQLGLWVLLGSAHRLTGNRKPHNSVYVINDRGNIVDRYDKRFCAGRPNDPAAELVHFSPGNHLCIISIRNVRCSVLICHEFRYPELYRACKSQGVQVVFHSFHAGHATGKRLASMRRQVGRDLLRWNPADTLPGITMPATMHAAAASNHVWISCSNTSARESCWPAFFVRPDGVITGRLQRNRAGVLISTVDTNARFYDSTAPWRDRAMRGTLHSGKLVDDARSRCRTRL